MSLIQMDIMLRATDVQSSSKVRLWVVSNRLNTILVPQAFMDWANQRFAPGKEARPSRLIVEVKNPADTAVSDYFQQQHYEPEATGWMPEKRRISCASSPVSSWE